MSGRNLVFRETPNPAAADAPAVRRHVTCGLVSVVSLVVCAGSSGSAHAQAGGDAKAAPAASRVITRERLQTAKKLMAAMGAQRRFERIIVMISKRLGGALAAAHPKHAARIRAAYADVARTFAPRSEDALGLIAPLYAEQFTVAEMRRALAFYESPLGQKFITRQAEIAKRSQSLGAVWGGRVGRQMQRAVLARLAADGIDLMAPAKPER